VARALDEMCGELGSERGERAAVVEDTVSSASLTSRRASAVLLLLLLLGVVVVVVAVKATRVGVFRERTRLLFRNTVAFFFSCLVAPSNILLAATLHVS